MPSIKLVLVIIDPTALPNAKSPFPCNAATTDADSSGSVVPVSYTHLDVYKRQNNVWVLSIHYNSTC